MIEIICVLKTGGDFDAHYVERLRASLKTEIPFRFNCLSDIEIPNIRTIPLRKDLPGWWSKLEIFSIPGPALYLDLDTLILGDIDNLLEDVIESSREFMMLEAFSRSRQFASGIMAWQGNWSWLVEASIALKNKFTMDQDCIVAALTYDSAYIKLLHRDKYRIKSYKHHNVNGEYPDCDILCFHGKPRPHEVVKDW